MISLSPSRKFVSLLFVSATVFTLALFLAHFKLLGFGVYGDGLGYFAPLRSLCFDGNLNVFNEFTYYSGTFSNFSDGTRWDLGIPEYVKYPIGMGLLLAPFFGAGHLAALILNLLQISAVPSDGFSWPYELAFCLGSIAVGIAGLVFTYKSCRLYFDVRSSLVAVLGMWFASPLFYYLSIEASMAHAVSHGLVSAFLYICLLDRWRSQWKEALLLGCLLGLAALVRPQEILFGFFPLVMALGANHRADWKRSLAALSMIAAVALSFLSIQLIAYWASFGTVLESPYMTEANTTGGNQILNWLSPKIFSVLFSGHRGLFVWHPITLLGIVGLVVFLRMNKKDRAVAAGLLAVFGLQIYLVSAWHNWWQGAAFGSRMLSNCTLPFGIGLAYVWSVVGKRFPRIPLLATGFLIAWNFLLMGQYLTGMIPGEAAVSVRTLLVNQVHVPSVFFRELKSHFSSPDR